jgi:nicotinamide mononucleotide transporter
MPLSPIELVAAAVGALSVYLSVRQHVGSWPTGIVNVVLYVWVFWKARLYADMGLQVVYAVISAYGWWHWLHGGAEGGPLRVSRMPARWWPPLVLLIAGSAWAIGHVLAQNTDAAIPYLDAGLTATSLAAQWMLTRKYVENWIVWIAVDLVYVPTFFARDLPATAVLYVVFLGLAVAGLRTWRRALAAPPDGSSGTPLTT